MTEPKLKDSLQTLLDAASAHMLDLNGLEWTEGDILEALNVLLEELPGMEEAQLRSSLETEDGYSLPELEKMASDLEGTQTESEWEEKAAELLQAFLTNLNLNGTVDLNPSYLYED